MEQLWWHLAPSWGQHTTHGLKKKKRRKKRNQCFCLKNKQQHYSRISSDTLHARNCKVQGPATNPSQAVFPLAFRIRFSKGLCSSVSLCTYKACLCCAGSGHDKSFQVAQTYPLILLDSPPNLTSKGKNQKSFTHFLISDLAKQFIITGGQCWSKQQLDLKYLVKGKRRSSHPHCPWSRQLILSQIPPMGQWVNLAVPKLFGLGQLSHSNSPQPRGLLMWSLTLLLLC